MTTAPQGGEWASCLASGTAEVHLAARGSGPSQTDPGTHGAPCVVLAIVSTAGRRGPRGGPAGRRLSRPQAPHPERAQQEGGGPAPLCSSPLGQRAPGDQAGRGLTRGTLALELVDFVQAAAVLEAGAAGTLVRVHLAVHALVAWRAMGAVRAAGDPQQPPTAEGSAPESGGLPSTPVPGAQTATQTWMLSAVPMGLGAEAGGPGAGGPLPPTVRRRPRGGIPGMQMHWNSPIWSRQVASF